MIGFFTVLFILFEQVYVMDKFVACGKYKGFQGTFYYFTLKPIYVISSSIRQYNFHYCFSIYVAMAGKRSAFQFDSVFKIMSLRVIFPNFNRKYVSELSYY